jgi:D-alanyl-D-alanine carboxypeptidase
VTQRPRGVIRRRALASGIALLVLGGAVLALRGYRTPSPEDVPGSSAWAFEHYGNPDAPRFKGRNIVPIEFLGRTMFVHKKVQRHFLRLERIFEARAPEYAAAIAAGTLDDWSYENRAVRGEVAGKSTHAFGLAIDINALTNVLGTIGDMPMEVVHQWEVEGGDWGGDWTRPDPMHFESHLTPGELRDRYLPDGSPKEWYLRELVGG